MKRYFVLPLLFALCFQLGCSEDSSTGPEDNPDYTLEETATIGSAGGAIEIDDFTLTIPAGAFSEDFALELFASSEDRPLGQQQITRSFRLEGLPDEYSAPLQLSVKYEGTLSDESFIAMGEGIYDYVQGESATVYGLLPASDQSGYLTGEIPPVDRETGRQKSGATHTARTPVLEPAVLELLGMSGYHGIYTDHFWIGFPLDLVEVSAPAVEVMLEEVYSKIVTDLQFPWPWPGQLNVFVTDLGPSVGAYSSYPNPRHPMLTINRRLLSQGDFNTVRVDVGKELLSLLLISYDASAVDAGHFWLWNAVIAWSEKVFTVDSEYGRPAAFPGNEMAPFEGMRAGAGDGSDINREIRHGHGASAVIEYLAGDIRFGMDGIKGSYETIQAGSNPTAALLGNMDALVATWWPEFFVSYVGGGIYGIDADVFTGSSSTWTVDDVNDTLITFSQNYPDLSAKLFRIDLDHDSFDDSADLILTLTGELSTPVSIVAFQVDGSSMSYLGGSTAQGSAVFSFLNIGDLISSGMRQILIVAVNSNVSDTYMEQSNLDLEMKTEADPVGPLFNSFDFGIRIVGHWIHTIGEIENEYESDLEEEPWGYVDVIPGEMTEENTFEGSYASGDVVGEVMATFNAEMDTVLSVNLEMIWDPPGGTIKSHSFVALNVPRSYDDADWSWFRVDGAEVCSYLDEVQYMYSNPSADETRELTGYHCTDEGAYPSFMMLKFHKE